MKVTFIGGPYDRQVRELEYLTSCLYLPFPISEEEEEGLRIDSIMSWRHPNAAYDLDMSDGQLKYLFTRRVDYKPKETENV